MLFSGLQGVPDLTTYKASILDDTHLPVSLVLKHAAAVEIRTMKCYN